MTDRLSDLLDEDEADDAGDDPATDANPPFVHDADEDLVLPPRRRVTPLTVALCALLLGALAFGAGVLVQKHHDRGLSSSASGGLGAAAALGFPGGAPAGLGAAPGGATTGTGDTTSTSPVLIGTVVSSTASALTVKDLGGTTHVVRLTKGTTITAPLNRTRLKAGSTVSVYGTESSGVVSATNVTIR